MNLQRNKARHEGKQIGIFLFPTKLDWIKFQTIRREKALSSGHLGFAPAGYGFAW